MLPQRGDAVPADFGAAGKFSARPGGSEIGPLDLDDLGGTVYEGTQAAGHRRPDREYGP